MSDESAFADRLASAMRAAGYEPRPAVLEREFNLRFWGRPVTLQGVRRWLRGETLPQQEKLEVLAAWLNVEPQELRYGQRAVNRVRESRGRWETVLQGEERQVLDKYLALPVAERKVVAQVIDAFYRARRSTGDEE